MFSHTLPSARAHNPGSPSPYNRPQGEILPLDDLRTAIERLDESTAPKALSSQDSLLASTFVPLLAATSVPEWPVFQEALEKFFGAKKPKKEKIQGGELGIVLVLNLFSKLTYDDVRDVWGRCVAWIEKLVKLINARA